MQARFLPLAIVALTAPMGAQGSPARPWEHESSDLPVDPRLHFGHLANGLRWVWAANSTPPSRSYLRLHVDAGSLVEEEDERGMAHFLEHMAFNGSEHFPAGTLVEWFQRRGMAFGPDLNAHTGVDQTVYEIDLPGSD
jgi:zinc protease